MSENKLKEVESKLKEIYLHTANKIRLMLDERASIDVFSPLSLNGVKLKGICSIHLEQDRVVALQPYDGANLKPLEDFLQKANLGYIISSSPKENKVYATKEKLFDNVKKEIIIAAKKSQEQSLIGIRKIRQDFLNELKKQKEKEDIVKKMEKDLQKIVDDYNKKIKEIPTDFS